MPDACTQARAWLEDVWIRLVERMKESNGIKGLLWGWGGVSLSLVQLGKQLSKNC